MGGYPKVQVIRRFYDFSTHGDLQGSQWDLFGDLPIIVDVKGFEGGP